MRDDFRFRMRGCTISQDYILYFLEAILGSILGSILGLILRRILDGLADLRSDTPDCDSCKWKNDKGNYEKPN